MPAFGIELRATAIALIALGCVVALPYSAAQAQDGPYGVWSHEQINGVDRFWSETQTGSSFTIWCKALGDRFATILDIDIEGRSAPPLETVQVGFDGDALKFRADENGNIQMTCAHCQDQMVWIWGKMRGARMLQIAFSDGSLAGFGLTTTTAVMDVPVCKGL